jgi:hypothetical protein
MNAQNAFDDHERAKYHVERRRRAAPRPKAECVTESLFDVEPAERRLVPIDTWPDYRHESPR